jgi:hypothetical protein
MSSVPALGWRIFIRVMREMVHNAAALNLVFFKALNLKSFRSTDVSTN